MLKGIPTVTVGLHRYGRDVRYLCYVGRYRYRTGFILYGTVPMLPVPYNRQVPVGTGTVHCLLVGRYWYLSFWRNRYLGTVVTVLWPCYRKYLDHGSSTWRRDLPLNANPYWLRPTAPKWRPPRWPPPWPSPSAGLSWACSILVTTLGSSGKGHL